MARHVVHVADYGNRGAGSFVPAIVALARALRRRGDRCSLIVKHVEGAVWHEAAARDLDYLGTATGSRSVFNAVSQLAPDIVHVHFAGWTLPATAAAYARGARVIWHLHSAMENRYGNLHALARLAKYNWFGGGVHRFVAVSDSLRSAMARAGISAKRTTVIRNAVDTARFRPPSLVERAAARAPFNLDPAERVLLFFGRDVEIKGADIFWKALDGSPPVVVLGVGLPAYARDEFSARVKTIALPFVEDVRPLYWASDLLVMPSRREAAPYTMLEAICSGLPVVAGDIEPLAEIAEATPEVRLVRNESTAFAAAITASVDTSRECLNSTRARFGLERWVNEVATLYAA